ncbi:hypothetical protein T4D_16982 [Trichinella pseudospiralis]|uniref:Uncharacterized protein n=1 Tax=Trichinella pseudospiralis TaxID=6337 RepID=A0A0V1FQK3_TRIPS|nr:hypothetical protein T4D_16982 [Trichinella pseudospiralis]
MLQYNSRELTIYPVLVWVCRTTVERRKGMFCLQCCTHFSTKSFIDSLHKVVNYNVEEDELLLLLSRL